ncbi:GNAT family N-acetyltransferase [Parahaliea mediterranea]|uniref:GNAT family N-acetyltransferase n=1 Tax=Parahaliea mediterranea TaxID=651086 RepID=A0A939DCV1_9GAMM|nr:GNAT family N-acetyltransferase [Parahaliea mediterranea]
MPNTPFSPAIETERLLLSPLTTNDSAGLLAIFSDAEVMKYWNTAPWTSARDASNFIEQSNEAMRRRESITLAIRLKSNDQLVGKCMLFSYDMDSRRAEIGFGLSREAWGKGIIQEAGEALIQYGFKELGLRRIEAEIDPANRSSARALVKLGFTKEGFLRQRWEVNGVVSDSELYGRLASEQKP